MLRKGYGGLYKAPTQEERRKRAAKRIEDRCCKYRLEKLFERIKDDIGAGINSTILRQHSSRFNKISEESVSESGKDMEGVFLVPSHPVKVAHIACVSKHVKLLH